MCNCYGHKCEVCDEVIPMHIGDFKFPPSRFKAWCPSHVKQAEPGSVVFTLLKRDWPYRKGWKCAILGPEVGLGNGCDNHPNIGAPMSAYVVK